MQTHFRIYAISSFLTALTIGALGCSSSDSSSSTGPEQACLDTADTVGKAAQRCGLDYQANYNAFIQSGAAGSCANIVQVRDEASLRGSCFSWFRTASCTDLTSPDGFDPSCRGQLLRVSSASRQGMQDAPMSMVGGALFGDQPE